MKRSVVCIVLYSATMAANIAAAATNTATKTQVTIVDNCWHLNGAITYPGAPAAGLLLNVRMVNATFEDRRRADFDAEANTDHFIKKIPDYAAHGVRAFTLCLQGGIPGSGGQLIAFVPSLDLVVTRQTGGSGSWEYEEYLRRACAAVVQPATKSARR